MLRAWWQQVLQLLGSILDEHGQTSARVGWMWYGWSKRHGPRAIP